MEARQQRGLAIAATQPISQSKNGLWYVPSQSNNGKYSVRIGNGDSFCSCPDFENGNKCKHIFSVEFTIARTTREQNADGSITTVTESVTVKTTAERKSYPQDWASYNAAQINEREHFHELLADLCAPIQTPAPKNPRKGGRPALPLNDSIFSACLKVYSTFSARRFSGELKDAHEKGFIRCLPHFNSVLNVFDNKDVTPILKELVRTSALPLAGVEKKIAVDSTGFSGCKFDRWFDEKHGAPRSKAVWKKCHIASGCLTNIVTAADVLDSNSADSPQFAPLAYTTELGFKNCDYVADKAYTSGENFQTVADIGGMLYAPFKARTTGGIGGLFQKMYHLFCLNEAAYLKEYHARSNVESTFSAIKRKFGDNLRSKNDTAMVNEVYAKLICHNVCVLIQEMYVLGIDPTFEKEGCTKTLTAAH